MYKSVFGKLLKIFLYVALAGFALFLVLCRPISFDPYQQKDYYRRTLAHLDSIAMQLESHNSDTLQAGWSRQNITPSEPVNLMGYGFKGKYERVHDSLYVRAVVFSNGFQKAALISYDLMMVHPTLAEAVQQALDSSFLAVDHVYFTAVHTHNGYGGWAKGLAGKVIAGGYHKALVDMIVVRTKKAVEEAVKDLSPVAMGYMQYAFPSLVNNRLVKGGGKDTVVRMVKLHKPTGEHAVICTFAAHGTWITSKSKDLSADYPGALVEQLEADSAVDFALFAAGAVGSHSPAKGSDFSYQKLNNYAKQIADTLLQHMDSVPVTFSKKMVYLSLPVALGEPQLKISEYWRVRPWLFNAFFGEIHPTITMLQVGNIIFAGFPADFSGMLYPDIITPSNMHVIVTSFNGDYIGYIIPDIFYDNKDQETREMNWFGPHTGSYFVELTNRLLEILAGNEKKSGL